MTRLISTGQKKRSHAVKCLAPERRIGDGAHATQVIRRAAVELAESDDFCTEPMTAARWKPNLLSSCMHCDACFAGTVASSPNQTRHGAKQYKLIWVTEYAKSGIAR